MHFHTWTENKFFKLRLMVTATTGRNNIEITKGLGLRICMDTKDS